MLNALRALVDPSTIPIGLSTSLALAPEDPPDFDLLIIEADSARLASEGISIAATVRALARAAGQSVAVVRGGTRHELLRDLGELGGATARFLVLVGHSHEEGIGLSSDDTEATPWESVAKWLAPFQPETIYVVGCRAGSTRLADAMFPEIDELVDIYASPVKTAPTRAVPVLAAVVAAHLEERPEHDHGITFLGNVASFFGLGEMVRRFTFETWAEDDSPPDIVDAVEQGVSEFLEGLRDDWKANRRQRTGRPTRGRRSR
jgi:hypothetical protein